MKENPDLKMFVDEEAPGMSVDDEEDQIPELMAFQVTNTETGHVYIGDYEPYVTLIVVLADLSHVAGVSPYSIHLETDHEVLEHYSQKCEELFEGQAIVHLEFSIKQCPDFIFGGVGEIGTHNIRYMFVFPYLFFDIISHIPSLLLLRIFCLLL